jgi:phage regulator Rha-like protein
MNQLATISATQSMTSREIADLVESRHDSVKRSIERLMHIGVIASTPPVDFKNAKGVNWIAGEWGKYQIADRSEGDLF